MVEANQNMATKSAFRGHILIWIHHVKCILSHRLVLSEHQMNVRASALTSNTMAILNATNKATNILRKQSWNSTQWVFRSTIVYLYNTNKPIACWFRPRPRTEFRGKKLALFDGFSGIWYSALKPRKQNIGKKTFRHRYKTVKNASNRFHFVPHALEIHQKLKYERRLYRDIFGELNAEYQFPLSLPKRKRTRPHSRFHDHVMYAKYGYNRSLSEI